MNKYMRDAKKHLNYLLGGAALISGIIFVIVGIYCALAYIPIVFLSCAALLVCYFLVKEFLG